MTIIITIIITVIVCVHLRRYGIGAKRYYVMETVSNYRSVNKTRSQCTERKQLNRKVLMK